jgi:hypothetical protein
MAGSQVVPFNATKELPAHIAKFVETESNIDPRNTIPQLSFRGKVWRTVIDGEEKPLLNKDDEPVSTVHVVILDHNKARSRAFYEGAYEEGKSQPPACWSSDGDTPDETVPHPVAETCAKCPNSVKGSKITPNGKETTACSTFKRLAIIPLSDLGEEQVPPLLLRLAQTSMWDKNNEENEAKGYYAWDQYLDMLRKRGATHTGIVATKIRFDSRVAYPKLLFAASRFLADEELEIVKPLFKDERIGALLRAPEVAVAARNTGKSTEADDETPAPATAPTGDYDDETPAPAPKGKAKAAPPPADDDEEAPPPPAVAKGKGKAKAAPAPAAAAPAEDEPPPVAAKGKGKPAAKGNGKGAGLGDLVDEWDEV